MGKACRMLPSRGVRVPKVILGGRTWLLARSMPSLTLALRAENQDFPPFHSWCLAYWLPSSLPFTCDSDACIKKSFRIRSIFLALKHSVALSSDKIKVVKAIMGERHDQF